MSDRNFSGLGALWDMSKRSEPPTAAARAEHRAAMRRGLPEVRHKVLMRYERLFGVWRVTLSVAGKVLRECRLEQDHTLESLIERGRGFACLADRQAVEMGMRQGLGMVTLLLDAEQMAALEVPR